MNHSQKRMKIEMTQSQFVKSNFDRIKDDNYQTIDPRCTQALVETLSTDIVGGMDIIDSCSPQRVVLVIANGTLI